MGPPEGPPGKKARRPTALETRLEDLQKTLAQLQPLWQTYDPGLFMQQMYQTCEEIGGLTPNTIEEFIATGESNVIFRILDGLDLHLLENTTPTGSQPVERTHLYQDIRNDMIAYVERVRGCLKGSVLGACIASLLTLDLKPL